ncbi:MAG TPA: hypothetical protein VFD58_13575 [Blastocatellia bacterium]|nr:hypothetical protein [Blastocatellia bacterium]
MIKKAAQQGFSLIETVVALSISIGLLVVISTLLMKNQESFLVQAATTDLQQNYRTAMDLMTRDIVAAGAGLPQFLGPVAGVDGGTDSSGSPLTDGSGRPLTDELLLLYGDPSFPSLTVTNGPVSGRTASINVADPTTGPAPSFSDGDNFILYAVSQPNAVPTADSAEFDVFTLSSHSAISGGMQLTGSANSAVNPPNWSNIAFPSAAALRLVRLDQWIHYRVDTSANELQRRVNGGAWVTVARNITNLQIQYWIENIDQSTSPPTVTNSLVNQADITSANNRAEIRAIFLTLTGQLQVARVSGGQGQSTISQTIEITPRNLALPGFVLNR